MAQDNDDAPPEGEERIPAIFATIHFRSPQRPNGYTMEELAEINRQLNPPDDAVPDEPT